ncbi:DUF2878 domain-containing protein [Shewanella mangrovi]|uniref:DUF2878 domain-containing protein n=1 Tax=Shewanella mangrovi TaxID=1515746 RepID=UPI00068DFF91|nr:DUF2878 domain-containing protein [Shewanella mangrovi]
MATLFLTSVWFQCLWLMAVLGRETWQWWTVAAVLLTLVLTIRRQHKPWYWCVSVAFVGLVLDSVNVSAGFFVFATELLPLWLLALWFAFAWYSWWLMAWLARYPMPIGVLLCAVAGTASYLFGAHLQAVMLPFGTPFTAVVLLCEWGVLGALMLLLRKRI